MKRVMLFIALVSTLLISVSFVAQPANAQQGAVWTLEFFNNPYLTGDVVLEQQSTTIGFDWGNGSPGAGVPADNFSARVSTDIFLRAGTYRFYMLADDGAHLYVGFQSYINTYDDPRPGEIQQVDITLPTGVHHIQIDYVEYDFNAYLYLDWQNVSDQPTGPRFDLPPAPVAITGWTAEYFNNAALFGSPVAIQGENAPRYSWGTGAPMTILPADNFSARWSSVQFLEAGQYRYSVRADDGIRVTIDGIRYVDAWGPATNQTYSGTLTLGRGNHNFIIEYYEAAGQAFIDWTLERINDGTTLTPTPNVTAAPNLTGAYLVIDTGRLNVRSAPNPITGAVLTRVSEGDSYSIVGRNANSTWWQIQVGGITGWVSGFYVDAFNTGAVPQTDGANTVNPPSTGIELTTTSNLNIRTGPGVRNTLIGRIPDGASADILGRNSTSSWFQVNYNGIVGWVSAVFTRLPFGTNIDVIPITG